VERASRRGRSALGVRPGPRRSLFCCCDPGGARSGCVSCAVSGPLDAGERVVGFVRPGRESVLGPGDARYPRAAFYAYAHPAPDGFEAATLTPDAARWEAALGEYVLDWDDVCASSDPHAGAVEFARTAFRHACTVCEWDPALAATAEGTPPPVR
jgi:hypothetical protein